MVHRSSTCIPQVSTASRGSLEQPPLRSESDISTSTTWEDEITPSESNIEMNNDDTSIDRAYHVASLARARLQRVIERPDHDLRLLIGHANLLDHLLERIEEVQPGFTFERLDEMQLEPLTPSPSLSKPLRRSPVEDVLQRIDWSEDDDEDEFLDDEVYDESDDELEEPQKEVFDDVEVTVTPVVLCHERVKGVVRKPRKHDLFGRVIPFLERFLRTSTILSQSSSNCHHR